MAAVYGPEMAKAHPDKSELGSERRDRDRDRFSRRGALLAALALALSACQTAEAPRQTIDFVEHAFSTADVTRARSAILAEFGERRWSVVSETPSTLTLSDPEHVPANANDVLLTCNRCPASAWRAEFVFIAQARGVTVRMSALQVINPGTQFERTIRMPYTEATASRFRQLLASAARRA